MSVERVPRELFPAILALGRQLGDSILDGQIAGGRRLADLDAAVGAGGRLVPQPCVGQHVRKAAGTHKMPVATLQ